MSETVLKLSQIGENIVVSEYPHEQQPWRWSFQNGIVWDSRGEPVFGYTASFTLYSFFDIRQITLCLVYGTEPTDKAFLANMTLQGVFSPRGFGKGSISASSKEYAKYIGTPFELTSIYEDDYGLQLTIDQDLFSGEPAPILSDEAIRAFRYRTTEMIPAQGWPPLP